MEPAPHFTLGLRCAATEDRAINRWRPEALAASLCRRPRAKGTMRGTILCWVQDSVHGRAALKAAADLSDRLQMRLVLAHVTDGVAAVDVNDAGENAATMRQRREASRLVARLAAEHGLSDRAEHRSAVGDPAALLGQIAAEEGVDLIVVGAPAGERRLRRSSESRLVEHLESATTVPVLFVPPRRGRWRSPRGGVGATVD